MMESELDAACVENDDFVIDTKPRCEPEPEKPEVQPESKDEDAVEVYGSSDDEDDEMSMYNQRLGLCQMCEQKDAAYTCPRCEMKTCSLPCSRGHRKKHDCSGVRDRTKFVHVKKFTNLDLLSDYRLLEEAARVAEGCHKDRTRMVTRLVPGSLPQHLYRLKGAARERGIILRFLPKIFSKHKNNTTKYIWKKRFILWKITWGFDEAGVTFDADKVDENKKLAEALAPFLEDSQYKKVLETYQAASFSGVRCLLKAEGRKDAGGKFYELDIARSIKANLKGKLIVEHPVIHVVTTQHMASYEVIPDDTDEKPAMDWDGPEPEPEVEEDSPPPPPAEEPTPAASTSTALVDPDAEFERMYSEYYKDYLSQYMRAYNVEEPGQLPTELIDKAHWYERRDQLPQVQWKLSGGNGSKKAENNQESKVEAGGGDEDDGSPGKECEDKKTRLEGPSCNMGGIAGESSKPVEK